MKPTFDAMIAAWRELSPDEQFALVDSDNRPALKKFLRDLCSTNPTCQWTVEVGKKPGQYMIMNLGPNGERQYYMASPGKYGEPILTPEPDLAFDPPTNLTYTNVKGETVVPTEKISGIICKDGPRLSLTNAKKQGVVIAINPNGSIQVGDEAWWLVTLFSKDKNRVRNYDAYLVSEKPAQVKVRELADLDLFE